MNRKNIIFMFTIGLFIFILGGLGGSLLTKHNNTLIVALESRRVDILLNLLLGFFVSVVIAYVFYLKDMFKDSDKFCRSIPRSLHRIQSSIEDYLLDLDDSKDIRNLCENFFADHLIYNRFILDKRLKKIIKEVYNLVYVNIRNTLINIHYYEISKRKEEIEYTKIKPTDPQEHPAIIKSRLDNKERLMQNYEKSIVAFKEELKQYKNEIDEMVKKLAEYYSK